MNNLIFSLLGLILVGSMTYTSIDVVEVPEIKEPDFVDVTTVETEPEKLDAAGDITGTNFTDKLYSVMPEDKNYMFSPFSIKSALVMAANGAEGATRDEILAVVGIEDLDAFNKDMQDTIEKYTATDLLRFDISNSIWLNADKANYNFSNDFADTITKYYNGDVGTVTNNNAVSTINGWVNEKTNGKIPGIINSADFSSALVNAIYFKAKWNDEFFDGNTKPDIFTDKNGNKSEIDFMNDTRKIPYGEANGVKVVELEYMTRSSNIDPNGEEIKSISLDNTDVSMFILLSDEEIKNPEEIVSTLRDGYLMENRKVNLSIPKFKIEYSTELSTALYSLGIKSAFSNADFGKMFDTETDSSISSVIHKTYIEIDEEGTEAAAVTALILATSARPQPEEIIDFKADKPFTFLIRDNVSGETLFIGEYAFAQ